MHICARIALSRGFCGRLGVVETSHPSQDILDGKLYIVHPGTLQFDLVLILSVIQYLLQRKHEIALNIFLYYIENLNNIAIVLLLFIFMYAINIK